MKTPLVALLAFGLAVAGSAFAQPAATPKKKAVAPKAPNPVFAQVADIPGLPRVLLLGDSISMGYTLPVRAALQGRANVHRPAENCGDTARGVRSIDTWLGTGTWDVIHFNFGLHDLKYLDADGALAPPDRGKQVHSVAEYEANLRRIVARLQRTGARLIFATTTPVPDRSTGRIEHDEVRYNAAAVRVMRESGVAVNDLHAFVKTRQSELQRPNNVHFSEAGSARLAEVVVAALQPALAAAAAR